MQSVRLRALQKRKPNKKCAAPSFSFIIISLVLYVQKTFFFLIFICFTLPHAKNAKRCIFNRRYSGLKPEAFFVALKLVWILRYLRSVSILVFDSEECILLLLDHNYSFSSSRMQIRSLLDLEMLVDSMSFSYLKKIS